jgi:hypothetical protein
VPDQPGGGTQPLVITGLLRQVREQVPQVLPRVPDPAGLEVNPSRACITARVTSSASLSCGEMPAAGRSGAKLRGFLQQVASSRVQCGSEGVQVSRHNLILDSLALWRVSGRGAVLARDGGFCLAG